ncbi:S8 family serine peptidase [Shewanella woodyi]|uniref:Peptidase S8 and S53 subtilisin kexin sedolisin n=1 Tax=Shewanella woodyi (strain ATCC 51908 / MS32) TaxID=392500 RepID=B1KDE2_SHEWM|nr:S8 family serine peptidase [Shewanella woodyi]ACA84943.1 peptidase S8 and S53 subtilisin kexin sedolisin [Shewanella woodyi ATCC 51908]
MFNKLTPIALAIAGAITVSAAPVQAKVTQHEYVKDSILVVYKDNATKSERLSAQRLVRGSIRDVNADGVDDKFANLMGGKLANLSLRSGSDVSKAIKMISQHPAVKYAEPNYVIKAVGTPDDPSFASLWGMNNTGQDGGTADADIDAVEAWDISTGDTDVVVAVIDTGVDYNHEDLQGNIWTNPNEIAGNGIDDDGNGVIDDIHGYSAIDDDGDPMDGNGHGTHVSGTIGAKGNNGVGVAGVNWDVSIIGCQFLDAGGSGSTAGAIACIDYVTNLKVNHGVDVKASNNSWGGGGFSQALKDSIESGGDAGILFVAAAGNGAYDNDASPSYPASYDSAAVMAVASTDRNDNMSGFSQYGLTSVDIGAPGSAILSTTPGNNYSSFNGTSMATPHVVGAAALVWSINPDLTIDEMKQLLMDSGDSNADLTGKTVSGARLNVATALDMADPSPSYRFTVTPSSQTIEAGSAASYDFSVGSVADWDGTVALTVEVSPALDGVSLSTDSVMAGDNFTLDVMTAAATPWGDYTITVSGDDGAIQKSKSVSLGILPQGIEDYPYSNDDPVSIPDNDSNGIVSTIEVADDLQVFGVTADVNITHTWSGDLIVTLTSPEGTESVLHNRSGGSADDVVESWDLADFNGEMAMGTWTLSVSDNAAADLGTLNSWGIIISGVGDTAPAAPVAGFDYSAEGLSVSFTNTSTDANDDIVSYSWDFGDMGTSTDMSPSHTYASAGSYAVSLTVTDAEGNTDTANMNVDVFDNVITAEVLRAKLSRRGSALVDLTWDGANGNSVDIYRDGEMVATTENDGRYRDRFTNAPASVEYTICETGSSLCSDPITAQF